MDEPEQWHFAADDAAKAAHEVVHHTPDTPWGRIPIPSDSGAAGASIAALAAEFERLPPSIRGALGRATSNAARLSDDQLQGLAELLQNADDAGATTAYFLIEDDRLLFGHNGTDLTLADVWALTIPWLSEKSANAEALGRFGIGLKTLQSLSETLEVHNGYFHLSLGRSTLTAAVADSGWHHAPEASSTVFIVPFQHGATTKDEVSDWLASWGDAGLLFLRSLRSVALIDAAGETITRLHVRQGDVQRLTIGAQDTTRTELTASNGRSWLLYARNAPSPESGRAGKAHAGTTPVTVAFPRFVGDRGYIHVGLPVRPIGLPFRIAGQFDPLANRRDIDDRPWNLELLELLATLWCDAALDLFSIDAASAWATVPLDVEAEADPLTSGHIRDALVRHLMHEARLAFADAVRLDGGDGATLPFGDLAYETPDLTGILSDDDIRGLANATGVITQESRSKDDRWRRVLADLEALSAKTPTVVSAASAVQLLSLPDRPIAFLSDLTAAVTAMVTAEDQKDEELEAELLAAPCLVLINGARLSPAEATDLQVLLPAEISMLWTKLKIGTEIHPEYSERSGWPSVADWLQSNNSLRRSATDVDALRVLAAAGRAGIEFPEPLTDEQADALRAALGSIEESARPELGSGIGRAIRFEATVYDADGTRTRTYARPADAYFIEKEKNSWSIAAKRTPRSGVAPSPLFRRPACRRRPRCPTAISPPRCRKPSPVRAPSRRGGVLQALRVPGGWPVVGCARFTGEAKELLNEAGAQCTLNDLASPDLDKVLLDIANEKNASERRRRANALLGCLARNWDRLEPRAKVIAANPDNGWFSHGHVDAWWVNRAASIRWLVNGRGRPAAPGEVRLKTLTNEAMHGTDPALYLADGYDLPTHRDVLTALGVEGNPSVYALIDRLIEIRSAHLSGQPIHPDADDAHPMTVQEAADLAAPFYKALAAEVQGSGNHRQVGNLRASEARARFDRDDGLIVTNLGWRRTSLARSGDAVFGDLAAFVPAVNGAEPLWAALGVRPPTTDDAKRVIKQLSRQRSLSTDERQIMLEALRRLAAAPTDRRGQLRRQPVYVGSGWVSKRPVYAVANPLLADALSVKIPVWQPGGQLQQLEALIEPLALVKLESSHTRVLHENIADYDADLTATFTAAVRNLQTDLAVSAPVTAEALSVTWEQLAGFQVAVMPELRIQVDIPGHESHQVRLAAWLDPTANTMYVSSLTEAGRAHTGGYAIASLFDADPRELSHAWVVAWADAEAGTLTAVVVSAAERAAEDKRRREASQAALLSLLGSGMDTQKPKTKRAKKAAAPKPLASTAQSAPPKARTLVDIEALVLDAPEGRIVMGSTGRPANKATSSSGGSSAKDKLRDPDLDNPKRAGGPGRGPLNFTPEERETAGLELLRRVLAQGDTTLTDLRHQPNVGADAIDDKGRYYELKVSLGAIHDSVRLEDSQIERALRADDFYLVLVGNVEAGQGVPEVRIIHDPLHHLKLEPQGVVHLTGVLSAAVARSWTFSGPQTPLDAQRDSP